MPGIPRSPAPGDRPAQPPGLATLQQLRTQLGTALSPHQALALFAVEGPVCTLLVSDSDTSPPVLHHLPLGLQSLSQRSFQLRMPTPAQLETGIMEVEDAVMPLARLLPAHTLLATRDPLLRHLALQAVGGHAPGEVPAITREAIEALFERLVAQSSRHYSHQDPDLPQDPCTAAALLVSCTTGSAPTCGCCRTAWMPPLEHTPVTDLVAAMPHHQVARAARKNFQPKPPPARTTPA